MVLYLFSVFLITTLNYDVSCRKNYGEDKRPPKRLFTPEIKRFLKDWLVRRRENPYPNRDEKKILAVQTGLTYVQVCNWFANWRRKLKNAGKEPHQKTWKNLIKTYNYQVQGNVEHFSICSEDSIWEESEPNSAFAEEIYQNFQSSNYKEKQFEQINLHKNHCFNNNTSENQNQCYFISSTTENDNESNPFSQSSSKYKSHIIEKYLGDCHEPNASLTGTVKNKPSMISKWLESAANFIPSKNSYLDWTLNTSTRKKVEKSTDICDNLSLIHGRDELDAAEALTTLANARCKVINTK